MAEELRDDKLQKVSGGQDEAKGLSQEDWEKGICPKGVTEDVFPHIRIGEMGAHCAGRWHVNGGTEAHECDFLSIDRETGKYCCTLCGYEEK